LASDAFTSMGACAETANVKGTCVEVADVKAFCAEHKPVCCAGDEGTCHDACDTVQSICQGTKEEQPSRMNIIESLPSSAQPSNRFGSFVPDIEGDNVKVPMSTDQGKVEVQDSGTLFFC